MVSRSLPEARAALTPSLPKLASRAADYPDVGMIVPAAHRLASLAPRMRQAILMLAALFVAHDAIYLARLGAGDGYARAMSAQGHDAYWAAVLFVLSAGVALVGIATVTRGRVAM